MLKFFFRSIKDEHWNKSKHFRKDSLIFWENPTAEEIKTESRELKLNGDLVSDVLDIYESPRLEVESGNIYVLVRVPLEEESGLIATAPLMVVLNDKFVLILALEEYEWLKDLKRRKDIYTTQRIRLFLQTLFAIDSLYDRIINKINRKIILFNNRLEDLRDKDIANFVNLESNLNEFLNVLLAINHILESIIARKVINFGNDKDLMDDLRLNNQQLVERCKSNLNNLINIREAHETINSTRLNRTMKLLTMLTVFFAIPTMVTGFYGMNIGLPGADKQYMFWGLLVLIFFFQFMVYLFLNKRK